MAALVRYEGRRDSLGYDADLDTDEIDYRDSESVVPDRTAYYCIKPRGGAALSVTIDGVDENIFEFISKIEPSRHSDLVELCDSYGPVSPWSGDELLSDDFKPRHADLMEMLRLASQEDWAALEKVAAKLLNQQQADGSGATVLDFRRAPGSKQPRLLIVARDLMTFAALQACMAISEGQKIIECPNCKSFFAVGPNSGRKSDSTYCSPKCRVASHRAKS